MQIGTWDIPRIDGCHKQRGRSRGPKRSRSLCESRGRGSICGPARRRGLHSRSGYAPRRAVVAWSLNQSRFVFPGPGPGPVAVVLGQALLGKNEHIQIRLADYCEVTYLPQKLHALSLAEAYVEQLELTRGKFPFN